MILTWLFPCFRVFHPCTSIGNESEKDLFDILDIEKRVESDLRQNGKNVESVEMDLHLTTDFRFVAPSRLFCFILQTAIVVAWQLQTPQKPHLAECDFIWNVFDICCSA